MTFSHLPTPPEDHKTVDEPGVMHIGGPRSQRVWEITRWILVFLAIAGLMVILFIRFGASTLWAFGLVAFMLAWMTVMARWAGGDRR